MKSYDTSVVFMDNRVEKANDKLSRKRILAKDCCLCNDHWIHSTSHPFFRILNRLFHPSTYYCQCENNKQS
ncbi:hypothetical protein PQO03_05285 [Lentisphaera profundi]|uniref:Uncharacterized protein n=1 Tax=Lentisphaera profundi TaxID=1658616 RepID=A0ABY7VVR3_9BACT|nr:hypothetical protein [Lentisphaera profundi]WDE97364.1 hypothetical protein PQO03_05285 [Lentisphaera profundi]